MTPDEARAALQAAIREIVPDADLGALAGEADLRETYELDSLDWIEVVARLSEGLGVRIEEDDDLRTLDAAVGFLVRRAAFTS